MRAVKGLRSGLGFGIGIGEWVAMAGYARLQRACLLLCSLAVSNGHTWMFSKGRAWMQASLDAPFRARVTEAGQGTHVQLGPGQTTVLRWASSHNNTFSLAVISAADEEWFYHKDYYKVRALVHILRGVLRTPGGRAR